MTMQPNRALLRVILALLVAWTGAASRASDDPQPRTPDPALAARSGAIRAEYDAQQLVAQRAMEQARTPREQLEAHARLAPDEAVCCRRMVDLALTKPADLAARDALIWVINKPSEFGGGAYGDEFARAAALLVRHHGDDPVAVTVGLDLNDMVSNHHDMLVTGFYAAAKSREAKGIARLALAQYLVAKSDMAAITGRVPERIKTVIIGAIGGDGKPHDQEIKQSDEDYAYTVNLRLCDPTKIRAEANRLYHEVITDYGDVVVEDAEHRAAVALLKDPEPKWNGKPLTADEHRQLVAMVASRQTLGDVARADLDELENITPGKPAPEIEGMTLDGKPLKLSDHKGKVVVLVFWGSWCGPCVREIPRERELATRFRDRPFAILGVDCNEDPAAGRKAIEANAITWPNWNDGVDEDGPIVSRYHIKSYPTIFVIDAQGIIRQTNILGDALDEAVAKLVEETEAKRP